MPALNLMLRQFRGHRSRRLRIREKRYDLNHRDEYSSWVLDLQCVYGIQRGKQAANYRTAAERQIQLEGS